MAKGSIGAHRFPIMCATVVVVCLGWAPSQALALDVPIDPAPVSTVVTPVVTGVTSTTSDPVDTVSNTATGVTDPVSNTVSNNVPNPVDTVANTAAGAVGTASMAGGTLKTVNGLTAGTIGGVGPAETSSTPQAGQLSAMAGWSPRLLSVASDVNPAGDEGHAPCIAGVGTACQSLEGTGGSWTRSVADIIRKLLALSGMSALALFVLACCLTLAGGVALYQSRGRSELGPA